MVAGAQSIFSTAGGMFGTIILDIIALVFVWASFMAAKNVSKAVKAAIDPFEQMGKKIGELGMSLPKYMPLPGIGMSANSMSRVAEMPQNILNKKEGERL